MKPDKMDIMLAVIGVSVGIFTTAMIVLYIFTGAIPDTLCQCFYSICGGECGFMALIKSIKTMAIKRVWQQEDRKNGHTNCANGYTNCAVDETGGVLCSTVGESEETIVE